ncbi:hypothetical protein BZA05DRAFT_381653 [Tricharina praecox]|uniref:uncharacterized protein n=1 Tax=Tricharina praecox TaxID=43433 RepID=UPI00221F181A|nr:uncharacterized protein BZA05DRAFT_381653 [Tricharina praecox]KAI5858565.1 hypothetical protein BZA05DRAFT_381653 [Tricharina praecox]
MVRGLLCSIMLLTWTSMIVCLQVHSPQDSRKQSLALHQQPAIISRRQGRTGKQGKTLSLHCSPGLTMLQTGLRSSINGGGFCVSTFHFDPLHVLRETERPACQLSTWGTGGCGDYVRIVGHRSNVKVLFRVTVGIRGHWLRRSDETASFVDSHP